MIKSFLGNLFCRIADAVFEARLLFLIDHRYIRPSAARYYQESGLSVGDVAELYDLSILQAEKQLGIRHVRGATVYTGAWRSPAEVL